MTQKNYEDRHTKYRLIRRNVLHRLNANFEVFRFVNSNGYFKIQVFTEKKIKSSYRNMFEYEEHIKLIDELISKLRNDKKVLKKLNKINPDFQRLSTNWYEDENG